MNNLNKAQFYGLIVMFSGFAVYLLLVIVYPTIKILWITSWIIAFLGALTYVIATLPGVRKWLEKLLKK